MSTPQSPQPASDAPGTDNIWDEFWTRFPEADNRITLYFDMKLREQERRIASLESAFKKYVLWHGSCIDCHPADATPDMAEGVELDRLVNEALGPSA